MSERSCLVADCDRPYHGMGLCGAHYQRWCRHGDALAGNETSGIPKTPLRVRFWRRVTLSDDPYGCWSWRGRHDLSRRPRFSVGVENGKHINVPAPRFAYELFVGPFPDGATVDHLCCNGACVNPDHLEPVSMAENLWRVAARRRECSAGHAYNETNTYVDPTGSRHCRICASANAHKRRGSAESDVLCPSCGFYYHRRGIKRHQQHCRMAA